MGKFFKILLYLLGGMTVLLVAAVLLLPRLIDVQQYKPVLMDKVAEATGRPVTLGGDLNLKIFPWVGLSFSDLTLGNPQGFETASFVSVKSFEAHVKVLPLFSREVEIDRFVLDGPEIYLERKKDGSANWQGLGGAKKEPQPQQPSEPAGDFALKSVEIGEFAVLNGVIKLVDRQAGMTKEITGLNLKLKDVSLERPIGLEFSAVVDDKPVGLSGVFGPLGANPGTGSLPLDLNLTALGELEARLSGTLRDPVEKPGFELALDIKPFSPRAVVAALGAQFPVETADPKALDALALGMKVAGSPSNITISDGKLSLDGSNFGFKGEVKSLDPFNLFFDGELDAIDLDRYLPPKKEQEQAGTTEGKTGSQQIDYEPLRALKLDTTLKVGELKIQGGRVENILVKVTADKGQIQLNPLSMKLYGGSFESKAKVNVAGSSPVTAVELKGADIQVGPLLNDFAKKDVLEGALQTNISLTMKGDTPEAIKKSLNGGGELLFQDGAIVGIDLAGMVRNIQTSFGLAENPEEKPRTDFAELRAPFTLKNGLFSTPATSLQSPLIRVNVNGSANLVSEALDMKVRPKFVATLKGQGDTTARSGVMVPVLVKGTFSEPKFSPDLEGILQSQLENQLKGQVPDTAGLKETLEKELAPEKVIPKESAEAVEKTIKGLIPKFSFE